MEKVKEFILRFLDKEAECWTKRQLTDLNDFNDSVKQLYNMAIDEFDEGLEIYYKKELVSDEHPVIYNPRHLYKLSTYKNQTYGTVWVAYTSIKNPIGEPNESLLVDGFIIGELENELKILGIMGVKLNRSTMAAIGWEKSFYNPSDLNIKKLGKFVETERYFEPCERDDFSLKEYLKNN